jgi:2,3-bisphosphoglycerate-dependent phosphoglycerate mutase
MNLTTAYLIRHGDVEYLLDQQGNRLLYGPEANLSQTGKDKARTLAQDFVQHKTTLDVIYSSPFPRAAQTAWLIARPLGMRVLTDDRLGDTYAPNLWGQTISAIAERGLYSYFDQPTKDQEIPPQIEARMVAAFKDLLQANQGKTFALVSHGDPLTLLYHRLHFPAAPIPPMREIAKFALGTVEAYRLVLDAAGSIQEEEFIYHKDGGVHRAPGMRTG